jgi:hypothetical protein
MYGHIMLENFPLNNPEKIKLNELQLPLQPGFYKVKVKSTKM